MKISYISKIKSKISILSNKKTMDIFDGSYKSIYQGNGFDFENLREYIPGDNIRDIDWKATSRGNKILVKRYVAEKKHNIMIALDTGIGMTAHTGSCEVKKDVALICGGIIGYIAASNGDNVASIYNRNHKIQFFPFKTGLNNLEMIMTEYDREKFEEYETDIEKTLDYIVKNIKRKMILFVITDNMGISKVNDNILKKLSHQHNVFFISIKDANLSEGKTYLLNGGKYVPEYISENKKLLAEENAIKNRILAENEKKLIKNRISTIEIDNENEAAEKIIELLGGHRYANKC